MLRIKEYLKMKTADAPSFSLNLIPSCARALSIALCLHLCNKNQCVSIRVCLYAQCLHQQSCSQIRNSEMCSNEMVKIANNADDGRQSVTNTSPIKQK